MGERGSRVKERGGELGDEAEISEFGIERASVEEEEAEKREEDEERES